MAKKEDTSNKPWVSNYPPLAAWLEAHEAKCYWQLPLGGDPDEPNAYVERYMFKTKEDKLVLAIVIVYANKMGWEIHTPCLSNDISETLRDADKRLGFLNDGPARIIPASGIHCTEAEMQAAHNREAAKYKEKP